MALHDSIVMDGRDIGSYVLPNADVKIFQVASVETIAQRRFLENKQKGIECTLTSILEEVKKRDYIDSHRDFAPLVKANDAIEIDTSNLTIDEVVDLVLKIINEKVGNINE